MTNPQDPAVGADGFPLGEGDDGPEHAVPPDLLELHEVLEWQAVQKKPQEGDL